MSLTKSQCEDIFKKFAGADGLLTPQELKNAIKSFAKTKNMSNNDMDKLVVSCFQGMDQDGNQKITLAEFMNDMTKPSRKQKLEETFKKWDKDGSGYLSTSELRKAIMETMDAKTADDIIKKINDDHVTLDEFMAIVN
ncbi:hypothetical protein CHS0354_031528 [Potamilus streckersoni]|uniref:EF-hand domain-containing protein n=1 Tax=Potamilus streckersoni TaxID=2493646 RepID=A0AAE0SHE8_9BIVA|nr:hypothetical protein CHS0354_031528 [Potamilus streckersoni]